MSGVVIWYDVLFRQFRTDRPDAMSQVTNSTIGFAPVDGLPVDLLLGSIY